MIYREYGGEKVSAIGMGGHREGVETNPGLYRQARFFRSDRERVAIVAAAIDNGVTYFDTTFGCEIVSLGRSLKLLGRRSGLFVSGMRVDFLRIFLEEGAQFGNDIRRYTREEVDARLAESGLDYLDQFMLGAMEQGDPLNNPALMDETLDELERLRTAGKIRHYGFSCHDTALAAELLQRYPQFHAVMCPYSYANRKAEESLFPVIERQKTAFVAMKALVWAEYGIPITVLRALAPVAGWTDHDPEAAVARLALEWILANPLVTTTVPAMNTADEVVENTGVGARFSEEAESVLGRYREATFAHESVPLAIAGLLSDNLRVRGHALRVVQRKLGIGSESIDFDADDAESTAHKEARRVLDVLREDPHWSAYVDASLGPADRLSSNNAAMR